MELRAKALGSVVQSLIPQNKIKHKKEVKVRPGRFSPAYGKREEMNYG